MTPIRISALLPVILLACGVLADSATATDLAIPYARFAPVADGDLSEWREPTLQREMIETEAAQPLGNTARIRVVWTLDALWIAAEVADADLIAAPTPLEVEQFHQYDSLQVYIDPLGDSLRRMNGDDLDLLLMPDGRSGVLRGDDLVAELAAAQVPQRRAAPLVYQYAARRTPGGWSFELALPWSGLAVPDPRQHALRLDLTMNDWVEDHAPAQEPGFSADALKSGTLPRPASPADEVGTQLWPLTWSGGRDFGYPANWSALHTSGDAPWSERLLRRLGHGRFVLIVCVTALIVIVAAAALSEWRARRHLRALLARLQPPPGAAPEIGPTAILERAEVANEDAPPAAMELIDRRDQLFAERVLAYVREHLDGDLSPARLAEAMHVSLRSLQRHLRAGMDTSPQELVLAARLEAAHALIRAGGLRISEVAFRVGFDDLSHFSRRFRASYGVSPSQLAAEHRASA